jgi:DNA polymerase III subunit alpha
MALGDPEWLVQRALELGQTAIAITDTGNLYGAFEFYDACIKNGIKPIIGVEFQIARKWRKNHEKDNELYEIVLLAKNFAGYRNLIDLVTLSQIEGYWNWRPRIDFDLLEEYSSDLIALSGSMYGEIGQHIITGKEDIFLRERIDYYRWVFGADHFYLEIQEHPDRPMQSRINESILRLAKSDGYAYVGTNNSYYITLDDAEVQDMMTCVALGRALDDPDRPTLMGWDYSVRTSREMEEILVYASQACTSSEHIASMIDLHIDYGGYKIPVFPLSDDERERYAKYTVQSEQYTIQNTEEWLIRTLCIDGLNFRYGFTLSDTEKTTLLHKIAIEKNEKKIVDMSVEELYTLAESYYSPEKKDLVASFSLEKQSIIRRLEYELTVVDMMGFNGYFCIVADFIRYGKNNGIPVWPGRGSAAGAILAYLSGITDIDPLRYGLLFERFLNPARITMPDIDVDFSDEGRDQVLSYVREKYGADRVTQVCTFGTLAARAAVKDVGKALGMSFAQMNDFAKLIPARPGITLTQALAESTELKSAYDGDQKYRKILDSAIRLEWTVRQLWVHACAVIIAPEPMQNFCPLQPPPKDPTTTVTQFSAGPLEALGLLKMDFLGLKNLAVLSRSVEIVKRIHDKDIDLLAIDYEDPHVLELFGEWDMMGVFQFESPGMRRYLKELKPSSFEDLIAMVSLYRPGPMPFIPDFIDRKHGRKIVEYPHPSLEAILRPTYGISVYQEQIMQLVQAFAGFSLGEADILRRAIGKKKHELLMEQRGKFIDAAYKQWHKEDLAIYIFDEIIEPFAGYGFNKSHAACYSMIAYQTGYMKTYYPTEFMTALMVSDEEDTDRIRLEIEEARTKDINILPPDINESGKHFTYIDSTTIRFGLKAIKWLGEWPIDTIRIAIADHRFSSITDCIERTWGDVINKKSLEALIYAGALDAYGERASLLASVPKMIAYHKEIESKKETAQMGLFDSMVVDTTDDHHTFTLEYVTPMTFEERIRGEKSMIGYAVSWHALDGLSEFITSKSKNISAIYEWLEKRDERAGIGEAWWGLLDLGIESEDSTPSPPLSELSSEGDTLSNPGESIEWDLVVSPPIPDDTIPALSEAIYGTLIGVVHDLRKIQTKTGGMMLMATLESVGFIFRLTIFSRDYETYASKVEEDRILVIDGRIKFDLERDEISISPGTWWYGKKPGTQTESIKSFSITQFRAIAGVRDEYMRPMKWEARDDKQSASPEPHTASLLIPNTYHIDVPSYWTKDDLLDLRDYLEWVPVW